MPGEAFGLGGHPRGDGTRMVMMTYPVDLRVVPQKPIYRQLAESDKGGVRADKPPYQRAAGPLGDRADTLPAMDLHDFREYSPADLAAALLAAGSGLEVVCFEVQAADGTVVAGDVLQLRVDADADFDRTGAYRWLKITGREER